MTTTSWPAQINGVRCSDDAMSLAAAPSTPSDELRDAVGRRITDLLSPWFGPMYRLLGPRIDELVVSSSDLGAADAQALALRDPACGGDWRAALEAYRCVHAVLGYRAAHALLGLCTSPDLTDGARLVARQISEHMKVQTGVEIHPAATIGRGFVLDHGTGTVIGETAVLGANCYVLQGVVLGSRGIADNAGGKRHPTLGSHVEVGAFARVLGNIVVGDGSVIGCHALVLEDLPPRSRVSVLTEHQVVSIPTANTSDASFANAVASRVVAS